MSSSSVPSLDPNDLFIEDLQHYDVNLLTKDLKKKLLNNVFKLPVTPVPSQIPEALADRAVSGHFKYETPATRQIRDSFNSVVFADLEDIQPLEPLTDDATCSQRYVRAIVEAVTTYFRLSRDIIPFTGTLYTTIAEAHPSVNRPSHASAYLSALINLIFESTSGDIQNKIAAAAKLVAGIPGILIFSEAINWDFVGSNCADDEVESMYTPLLLCMVRNTINCEKQPACSNPGARWKLAMLAKLGTSVLAGPQCNLFDLASRLVDIDYAHNIIESGLALSHPLFGSAIVGPHTAQMKILYEMAGCVQERKVHNYVEYEKFSMFQTLHDEDKGNKVEILGIEVNEESMVSMDYFFTKGALGNFINWSPDVHDSVMISKHGIVLYFPSKVGPWYDMALTRGKDGRNPMKLVLRIPNGERGSEANREAVIRKSKRLRADWLSETPVSEETKRRFRYIVNKSGRTLVKRHGIRGYYGRIIVFILVVCGIVVSAVNLAERENWLERVFDGAQAASLLAAAVIVIIFFRTGTLTNTLDLLAGVTEAQDIEQIALLTGLSMEELQGVLTYARGTLYWLSENRASYCRAIRLGSIVMTSDLDVSKNAETRTSFVAESNAVGKGERNAIWVMQNRLSRMAVDGTVDGLWNCTDHPLTEQLVRGRGISEDFIS